MLSNTYIQAKFDQLSAEQKVDILFKALDFMKEDSDRFVPECLALAMNIPLFPKVSRILEKDGYELTLLFDNGEERSLDFREFFNPEKRYDKILLDDIDQFNKVAVEEDTLVWRELGYWTAGIDGQRQFMYYDIDPGLLYEAGQAVQLDVP